MLFFNNNAFSAKLGDFLFNYKSATEFQARADGLPIGFPRYTYKWNPVDWSYPVIGYSKISVLYYVPKRLFTDTNMPIDVLITRTAFPTSTRQGLPFQFPHVREWWITANIEHDGWDDEDLFSAPLQNVPVSEKIVIHHDNVAKFLLGADKERPGKNDWILKGSLPYNDEYDVYIRISFLPDELQRIESLVNEVKQIVLYKNATSSIKKEFDDAVKAYQASTSQSEKIRIKLADAVEKKLAQLDGEPADKSALSKLYIDFYKAVKSGTYENVSTREWDAFVKAMKDSRKIFNDKQASQADINALATKLTAQYKRLTDGIDN